MNRLLGTELEATRRFGIRFEDAQADVRRRRLQNDPRLQQLDDIARRGLNTVFGGLEGLNSPGGLPSDVRRDILENVRTSQAARGALESDVGIVEEAARLAGGREAFRANRIAQAMPFISAGSQVRQGGTRSFGVLGQFAPTPGAMLQGQLQSRGIGLQAEGMDIQQANLADQARGQMIGTAIGLGGSVLTGGMLGAGGAAGFGGSFGSGAMSGLGGFFGMAGGGEGGGFF